MLCRIRFAFLILKTILAVLPSGAEAGDVHLYVSPTGSDTNDGYVLSSTGTFKYIILTRISVGKHCEIKF